MVLIFYKRCLITYLTLQITCLSGLQSQSIQLTPSISHRRFLSSYCYQLTDIIPCPENILCSPLPPSSQGVQQRPPVLQQLTHGFSCLTRLRRRQSLLYLLCRVTQLLTQSERREGVGSIDVAKLYYITQIIGRMYFCLQLRTFSESSDLDGASGSVNI